MTQVLGSQSRERRIRMSSIFAGQVIEFSTGRELVTGKSNIDLDTLCRDGEIIIQGKRYWSWTRGISNKHELTRMRTYEPSEDLAKQRIYDALNQLLNEHGITE